MLKRCNCGPLMLPGMTSMFPLMHSQAWNIRGAAAVYRILEESHEELGRGQDKTSAWRTSQKECPRLWQMTMGQLVSQKTRGEGTPIMSCCYCGW